MTAVEVLCSCHASPARLAARELETLGTHLDPDAEDRAIERAAALAGEDTMIVVVRDGSGTVRWQLLPRAA